MDIETKEAVLKLAGYEVEVINGGRFQGDYSWSVRRSRGEGVNKVNDYLALATTHDTTILHAYNTFLTRQNEVIES